MFAAVIMVNRVYPRANPTIQKQTHGRPCQTWPGRDRPQRRLVLLVDSMLLVVVMWYSFSTQSR